MTRNDTFVTPHVALAELIDTYGLKATLRALATVVVARPKRRPLPMSLSAHLKRDIGLEEVHAPPPVPRGPMM